ncbi:unnamed protein product [Anisakis simplex]|uniref:Fatty-acid amide hydrolase 1 (inferred by orthology to a human protein) n=1 Tax=Anisakis simplex TaxID=6269 RepID=A0A0M3JZ41_ANISI|nr:unnamed protein product [Anisakis simplex]
MWTSIVNFIHDTQPSTGRGLVITIGWSFVVLYLILKSVVEKAWGAAGINRRNMIKNDQLRKKRFEAIRERIDRSEAALERYAEILKLNFFELKEALQNDRLSATAVLNAYLWKAFEVNEKTNCIIEFLIESFDEAENLDQKWHLKPNKPPLFGLPFSVKGNFYMKGYDCCIGLAKNLFKPMQTECTLVTHLRNQGAVPFVMTNVPQALLSFTCSNSVYGTTSHPKDANRTPGGSSGGEAALLSSGGCVFGTGSDLAGSLRIPAVMCGLVTLKPSESRFVVYNAQGSLPGKGRIGLGFGFLTKSVEELKFLTSDVLGTPEYHKLVSKSAPLPLSSTRIEQCSKRKLRIGYYVDDGFMKPVPALERTTQETVEYLREAGHEMVRFHIPQPHLAASLFYKNLLPDGGELLRRMYSGEVITPYMKRFVFMLKIPKVIRTVASWLLSSISPQLSLIAGSTVSDLGDLRYTQQLTDQYIKDFINEWKLFELDVLICPAFTGKICSYITIYIVVPSVPHQYPSQLSMCGFATGLYSMLDFPVGIVPTREVTKEDDALLEDENYWPVGMCMKCLLPSDLTLCILFSNYT